MRLKRNSYAKINLSLEVTGLREDGYHQLCMVMHSVELYDTIFVKRTHTGKIILKTNLPFLPTDRKNHAYKAAELFFEETGIPCSGLFIDIKKKIPVCAGLAGGSGNAAAVLHCLNDLYHTNLSKEELCKIGYKIGADVPYCICGGTMLAKGIGEQLTPLPALPKMPIVLAKPDFGVSTPAAFQQWDKEKQHIQVDTAALLQALELGNPAQIASLMANSLEQPAFEIIKNKGYLNVIPNLKACMLRHGALGALMSGSGPTVFGMFSSEQSAHQAAKELKTMVKEVFVTTT